MRKIFCLIGLHRWVASLEDYIEQFGCIPLNGEIADTAICQYCGKKYKEDK